MKIFVAILVLFVSTVCYSADNQQMEQADKYSDKKITKDIAVCDTYEDCLKLGLSDRENEKDSVLLFYSSSNKDIKYNLYDNLTVKFSSNICPPLINVYKSVNNINFLMDVFKKTGSNNDCIGFYSNITGDGKNRDAVIGQLEIYYCNEDILYETCENGIIYSKINMFDNGKSKNKYKSNSDSKNQLDEQSQTDSKTKSSSIDVQNYIGKQNEQ